MYRLQKCKNLMVAFAFAAAMTFGAASAHAQLTGELEANVPFAFRADNTKLPAGTYIIRPVDDVGGAALELENLKKDVSVFLMPENSHLTQAPNTSELTFDKIGNSYFLRQIEVEDSQAGYALAQSKSESMLMKGNVKLEKHKLAIKHHKTSKS